MQIEHVKAIFLLAGMDILSIDQEENPYCGSPATTAYKPEVLRRWHELRS
jgi:hypothetical protein